jgi:hypothetical protein
MKTLLLPFALAALLAAVPVHAQNTVAGGITLTGDRMQFTVEYSVEMFYLGPVPISGDLMATGEPFVALGASAKVLPVIDLTGLKLTGAFRDMMAGVSLGVFVAGTDFEDWRTGGAYWKLTAAKVTW